MQNEKINEEKIKGYWIKHDKGFWTEIEHKGKKEIVYIPDYECSVCGSRAWKQKTNYCPQCGADMRGAE